LVVAQADRVVALFHSAFESQKKNWVEKVIEVLRTHANEPSWSNAIGRCAQIAAIGDDIPTAQLIFGLISKQEPNQAAAGLQLAKAYYRHGEIAQAKEFLLQLIAQGAASAEAQALLGNCYESEHQPVLAMQAYQHAIELEPSQISYYMAQISLQLDMGKTKEALALVNRVLTVAPNDSRVWVWKGNTELHTNSFKDAKASFTRASELDSLNADAILGLAGAESLVGSNEEAIVQYKIGIGRFPEDPRFYIGCAGMFLASSNASELEPQTESLLKEAVKLDPRSAEAHYQLGQ